MKAIIVSLAFCILASVIIFLNLYLRPLPGSPVFHTGKPGNEAIHELSRSADIHGQLLRRRGDAEFQRILTQEMFDLRDLEEMRPYKAQLFEAMGDHSLDDVVRRRLAVLSFMPPTPLANTAEEWSMCSRTILGTCGSERKRLGPDIFASYSENIIGKYPSLSFEEAFHGWGLDPEESARAASIFKSTAGHMK